MTSAGTVDMEQKWVFGGVDSHADTIHAAVVTGNGGHLADAEFPTTTAGYTAALAFLGAHGDVVAIGVEGTASYGAGFTRAARAARLTVVEVNRPDRAEHRRSGKSDPIDAYAAARAALSGRASSAPKDETVTGIRALHNAAWSTVKARIAAINQIGHILVSAPDAIRDRYRALRGKTLIDTLARQRPHGDAVHTAVLTALKSLARRVEDPHRRTRRTHVRTRRRGQRPPLPHSPRPHGQRRPHTRVRGPAECGRPNKEGDHPSPQEAIAREVFCYLTTTVTVPDIADLRPLRRSRNITLTTVAEYFGVWPAVISCVERSTRRGDDLAGAYREWLTAA
ncbi:transposase [Streptomyces sp. NPDC056431]|uniref:IS110 family transposase n=1 Tax=Streptomyces sp. NPDC056431 TaxID=3345814 RepID=UPI00368DBF13